MFVSRKDYQESDRRPITGGTTGGEISADDAEAATILIASSPAPLFGLRVLAGRRWGRGRFGGGLGRRDNDDAEADEVIPSTPAASV